MSYISYEPNLLAKATKNSTLFIIIIFFKKNWFNYSAKNLIVYMSLN